MEPIRKCYNSRVPEWMNNELSHEEAIAVAKIKEDPNFFFRYAKRFSITKQEIGPFYSDNGSWTNDKNLFIILYSKALE